jgi:chromosome segregation ATPase
LESSKDEYETLKDRVKMVAGELKERRAECRILQSEADVLKYNNEQLHDRITGLEAQGMDMNVSTKETTQQLNELRGQLMDKKAELELAQASIAAKTKTSEDALGAYKKKAQQSLAVANARTASAVQAKEEAEMEARAARSTADSAMGRAMVAEQNGKEALAEAKSYVAEMESKVSKFDIVQQALDQATVELERVRGDAQTYQGSNEQLTCELQSLAGRLEAEQKTSSDFKQELGQARSRSTEFLEEVERLRREGQRLKEDIKRRSSEKDAEKTTKKDEAKVAVRTSLYNAEMEATIAMLQQELQDANQAIKELKETLKLTVEEQQQQTPSAGPATNGDSSSGGMPLFYAMEKQAELTQARNEIARLANLLGSAESTKQEALENMGEMQLMMQDAQSRLKRQEQLQNTPEQTQVNLEYLKNIMLSYLNAKSVAEKKTLLPVIGTVLCLTTEEQRKAAEQLETSGRVTMDSVSSSLLNLKWS